MHQPMLADRDELPIHDNGQDWFLSWHPPTSVPDGTPHGAAGICVTDGGRIVLISANGSDWDLPAGRPEDDETWEQTLRREMLEEACARVVEARLLGFARGRCVAGQEAGLVLVRSFWLAQVELDAWEPQFEITHRRVVAPGDVPALLAPAYLPIFRRAFNEAAIVLSPTKD